MFQYLGVPEDDAAWRSPMLAATGSFTAIHQDPHSVGTVLRCKVGHKLLFFLINMSQPLIVRFNEIRSDSAIRFEYLFHPPHKYSHFILSPGQTLIMAPGQIHFYTVKTRGSWVDSHQQLQQDGEMYSCEMSTAMLLAFVMDSCQHLSFGYSLVGNPPTEEVFSAMFMAITYASGEGIAETAHHLPLQQALSQGLHCLCMQIPECVANLSDPVATQEEVDNLHQPMRVAVWRCASKTPIFLISH
ncbi:uncharacterized protein EI90DRAFT_3022094 [Cantharellus anzutake]|uniref:uncharacterized protein n=1 Tax=Cantharellus anzutake TaxID=1750568 RepID=UPI001904E5F5|nr:uncharacterized protein EI90DRAFT_3022094 [Cantharellus anzutake]KAF8315076.1 hypothetical protein EI90DRAFT_3022094 [Cantharellus anzutake]